MIRLLKLYTIVFALVQGGVWFCISINNQEYVYKPMVEPRSGQLDISGQLEASRVGFDTNFN